MRHNRRSFGVNYGSVKATEPYITVHRRLEKPNKHRCYCAFLSTIVYQCFPHILDMCWTRSIYSLGNLTRIPAVRTRVFYGLEGARIWHAKSKIKVSTAAPRVAD